MKRLLSLLLPVLVLYFSGCNQTTQWEGQPSVNAVPTSTLPIQEQCRQIFEPGNGIYASNDFDGARLNGIVLTHDTLLTVLITPENTPINPSPWYAFNLWSAHKQTIHLQITYTDGYLHRYHPKISNDNHTWKRVDSTLIIMGDREEVEYGKERPVSITFPLEIGPDTLWVAAHEILDSDYTKAWIDNLEELEYVEATELGKSKKGKPVEMMKIGNSTEDKLIFVMSGQHPPEKTGYKAMESFVEAIASNNPVAEQFRNEFTTYVVPLANPDGTDMGHWRHNAGGIDLNRDWENRNQPEVRIIQDFMLQQVHEGAQWYFAVDFHSTWEDIYYTMSPDLEGNMPGLVPEMIYAMSEELALTPNIKPHQPDTVMINSSRWFFFTLGAESLTYEIGDNTPDDLIKEKGEISALKMMEIILNQ